MTTTAEPGFLTVPDLQPILAAVAAARDVVTASEPGWSDSILAGNATALAAGERLLAATTAMERALVADARGNGHPHLEVNVLDYVLGAGAIVDAVLVATGEMPHPDPEVHARFLPARLASERRMVEGAIERAGELPLDDPERQRLLDQWATELERIDAGIEDERVVPTS